MTTESLLGALTGSLLGTLEDGVLFLDPQFRVLRVNRAFVQLTGLGLAPEQLLGTPLPAGPATYQHLYRDPDQITQRAIQAQRAGQRIRDEVFDLADGQRLAHTYTPATEGGSTVGHLWLLRPAAQPAPTQVDPAQAGIPRNWAELAATIAHEARTPATSLVTYATLLDDANLGPEPRHEAVRAVCRNADRILMLASDLLFYANLDLEVQHPSDCPVNLIGMIRSLVADQVPPIPVEASPGPLVRGDESQLRLALAGVIGVVTQVAAGNPVRLEATCPSGSWTVSVSAPIQRPITQEFLISTRIADPTCPDGEISRSAALTLLLARAVAQHHGGFCSAENLPDRYRIVFHLPTQGLATTA